MQTLSQFIRAVVQQLGGYDPTPSLDGKKLLEPDQPEIGQGAEGAASSELVLSKEEGGVFWPLFKQQPKPGQRFMLEYSKGSDQITVLLSTNQLNTAVGSTVTAPDSIFDEPCYSITVGYPVRLARRGNASLTVEVYALGSGVSIEGEGSDLSGAEAAFELDPGYGSVLQFAPHLARVTQRSVVAVERDIATIWHQLQTEDEPHPAQLIGATRGFLCAKHIQSPKSAIVSLRSATGKTTVAEQLAKRLGCKFIWDEWVPGKHPILPGTLHLTNAPVSLNEVAA